MAPFKHELDGPALYHEFISKKVPGVLIPEMLEKYNHFLTEWRKGGLMMDGEGALLNPMVERLSRLAGFPERLTYAAGGRCAATINVGDLVPGGSRECQELRSSGWFEKFFEGTDLVIKSNLAVVKQRGEEEVRLAVADGAVLGEREKEAIGALLVAEAEMLAKARAGGLILAREKAMGRGFLGSGGSEILAVYVPMGTRWDRVLAPVSPARYLRERAWETGPKPVVFLKAMADGEGPR